MSKKPGLTIDEEQRIKGLIAVGKTFHAVAKEVGRDEKTVKKYASKPEAVAEIMEIKKELADWFEGIAERMLTSITDKDIEKISAYQRTLSAAVATDKMRLLREQSTENVSILISTLKQLQEYRHRKLNLQQVRMPKREG